MALIVVSAIELQAVATTTNLISATPNSRRPRFVKSSLVASFQFGYYAPPCNVHSLYRCRQQLNSSLFQVIPSSSPFRAKGRNELTNWLVALTKDCN